MKHLTATMSFWAFIVTKSLRFSVLMCPSHTANRRTRIQTWLLKFKTLFTHSPLLGLFKCLRSYNFPKTTSGMTGSLLPHIKQTYAKIPKI